MKIAMQPKHVAVGITAVGAVVAAVSTLIVRSKKKKEPLSHKQASALYMG